MFAAHFLVQGLKLFMATILYGSIKMPDGRYYLDNTILANTFLNNFFPFNTIYMSEIFNINILIKFI